MSSSINFAVSSADSHQPNYKSPAATLLLSTYTFSHHRHLTRCVRIHGLLELILIICTPSKCVRHVCVSHRIPCTTFLSHPAQILCASNTFVLRLFCTGGFVFDAVLSLKSQSASVPWLVAFESLTLQALDAGWSTSSDSPVEAATWCTDGSDREADAIEEQGGCSERAQWR